MTNPPSPGRWQKACHSLPDEFYVLNCDVIFRERSVFTVSENAAVTFQVPCLDSWWSNSWTFFFFVAFHSFRHSSSIGCDSNVLADLFRLKSHMFHSQPKIDSENIGIQRESEQFAFFLFFSRNQRKRGMSLPDEKKNRGRISPRKAMCWSSSASRLVDGTGERS